MRLCHSYLFVAGRCPTNLVQEFGSVLLKEFVLKPYSRVMRLKVVIGSLLLKSVKIKLACKTGNLGMVEEFW